MAKLKAFTMPKWGIEMAEGTIAEWMVAENAAFRRGTVLTLIETDKITNEVEAETDGRFVRILAKAGETYPVGALLAVLSDGGEASAAEIDALVAGFRASDTSFDPDAGDPAAHVATAAPVASEIVVPEGLAISPAALEQAKALGLDLSTVQGSGRNGRISAQDVAQAARAPAQPALVGAFPLLPEGPVKATPVARRLALLHEIDLAKITGTGPRGRVRRDDVLAAVANAAPVVVPEPVAAPVIAAPMIAAPVAAAAGAPDVQPMSSMRRTIARRLTQSKQEIPHFYVRRRVRADRLLTHRAATTGDKPSVNDYLIRACALALLEVPAVNIQVHGNDIHRFAQADISVAVATDRGLVTPIVFGADDLSLAQIASAMKALAQKARTGKLRPEEIAGGSFSLSNLGSFGVEQFDAIINPPQGAILAVGTARPEPIDDAGAIRIVPVLNLSLSCDHRAIDGADAGRFMAALARLIEQPELLA
ncbi:2-oxo acid dehydrogenase subunit E2 [Novosphingobium sp.]|uniref:2-oxo acid dehydrogenase subunit E2 n=1 Tax=Novosphingobium sp. TaxID=1874826 RepID=UPI00262C7922|nr:2-oxo acid dehydrogenase subunit E2 [Novosphingobium sp.]